METKFIEIRDHGTRIPALAIEMLADDKVSAAFLRRCGYPQEDGTEFAGTPQVVLMRLSDARANSSPHAWADRTMLNAHLHISYTFRKLQNGEVVDVRWFLQERPEPAAPEIYIREK